MRIGWVLAGAIALSAGVAIVQNRAQSAAVVTPEPVLPSRMAEPASEADPEEPASELSGEVLEVLQVPSYTYLRLRTPQGEVWAAVSTSPVEPHQQVRITAPAEMRSFESKTLKRTFDVIYFGALGALADGVSKPPPGKVDPNAPLPPGHPPVTRATPGPVDANSPLPPGHPRVD